MIEINQLTKRYGKVLAVDGLTFMVRPGQVTGFFGPNGSGKSTTPRMLLGLNTPTSGTATIDGRPFHEFRTGLHHVGALPDGSDVHRDAPPARTWPHSPAATVRPSAGSRKSWRKSARARRATDGSEAFPSACASAWGSPQHCSGIHPFCSSTSRSTAWTPWASAGPVSSSGAWPPKAAPFSSPAT
ncbi:hypothetical protein AV521_36225 [Streptomyces sp. IMTB 2501]|nr:hypothetical protein AV521_36225 [Streptomyces sp. IMTB 2501]